MTENQTPPTEIVEWGVRVTSTDGWDRIHASGDEAEARALVGPSGTGYTRTLVRRTVTFTPWEDVAPDPAPLPGGVMTDADLVTRGTTAAQLADQHREEQQ